MIRCLVRCVPMLVFLPIALAQNSPSGGPAMTTPQFGSTPRWRKKPAYFKTTIKIHTAHSLTRFSKRLAD